MHETPEVETREHPPLPASERDLRWKQASRNPRFRLALIVGGIVLLVAGFFLWRYLGSYESTDDAQIDGHLNAISTRVSGHVIKLLVNDNQYVEAGTPLVEIDPKDYEVAVASAKAAYQDALATAESMQVNVPITTINTGSQLSVVSGRSGERTRPEFRWRASNSRPRGLNWSRPLPTTSRRKTMSGATSSWWTSRKSRISNTTRR